MKAILITLIIAYMITIFKLQSKIYVDYRLPNDVYPLRYYIEITPYFLPQDGPSQGTFMGQTSIAISTPNPGVRQFSLHAKGLEFNSVIMQALRNSVFRNSKTLHVGYDNDDQTGKMNIYLDEDLEPNREYLLSFKFMGPLYDDYEGLYRKNYIDVNGRLRWIVATAMRFTNARKIFPCFDEPQFRSIYRVNIIHPKGYTSFTNTYLDISEPDTYHTERVMDTFKNTSLMSTYQVGFVVCQFTPKGYKGIYIMAQPDYGNMTEFMSITARQLLSRYMEIFDTAYVTLGNGLFQMITVPGMRYKNGAGHWGILTFDEDVLALDEDTDLSGMQYAKTALSYQIVRQWFGSSITCEWWGYLWVNEALANYYKYFGTHEVFNQYELDQQFIIDELHYVLSIDDTESSLPLNVPTVASPSEIANMSSKVICAKGATVIRMIYHAMSGANFDKMIQDYVKNNYNKTVSSSQLLSTIAFYFPPEPKMNLTQFFSDWTDQVGYPLLTVTLAADNKSVKVEQKRYLLYHDGSDPTLLYTVPLTYTTNRERDFSNTFPRLYFNRSEAQVNIKFPDPVDWVMFNIQQTAYYRIMYDKDLWQSLAKALLRPRFSGIHELNRAQYIDDLFSFGKSGRINYDLVFKWLEFLKLETHYIPWAAALKNFDPIMSLLTEYEHRDFGKYILFMTEKAFNISGIAGEFGDPVMDVQLRKAMVNINCRYGKEACVNKVEAMFSDFLNNRGWIEIDMRSTVYCAAMRNASETDFNSMLNRYRLEKERWEKLRLRYALGCSRNMKIVYKFLNYVLDGDIPMVEKEEALKPIFTENQEVVWPVYRWLTLNYENVAHSLKSWETTANLFRHVAKRFTLEFEKEEFNYFIQANGWKFNEFSAILEDASLTVNYNLKWRIGYIGPLKRYLESESWKDGTATNFINLFLLTLSVLSYVLY